MFGLFEPKTTPLVGIDISSSSIKLIEIEQAGSEYRLSRYAIERIPEGAIIEKSIKQVSEVADSIRAAVKHSGTSRHFAAVGVSGASVMTRVIQVNAMYSEEEIIEQIELESERYFPYSLDDIYYDFEIIGPSSKNPQLNDVLLAASKIETIETRLEAVEAAGLKATIVDVEALAMERAFGYITKQLTQDETRKNIALFDLGSAVTTLTVFQNMHPIYSRDQGFGVKQLLDEIQRRYGLTGIEALAALKYGGLPEDYQSEVLGPFRETVAQQMNRALQIFFSSTDETEVQYLSLSGGGAQISGLENSIQQQLKIKTFIANPFSTMQIAPTINRTTLMEDAPSLLVGCGLALRNFDHE